MFLALVHHFKYVVKKVENLQKKSWNKMKYISSVYRVGGTFYNVNVYIRYVVAKMSTHVNIGG